MAPHNNLQWVSNQQRCGSRVALQLLSYVNDSGVSTLGVGALPLASCHWYGSGFSPSLRCAYLGEHEEVATKTKRDVLGARAFFFGSHRQQLAVQCFSLSAP